MVALASVVVFVVVGNLGGPAPPDWGGYLAWVGGMARGDLGWSPVLRAPVASVVALKAWPTVLLLGSSLALTVALAVPFGVYSAVRRGGVADYAGRAFFVVGYSLPSFWLAAILQLVLGVWLAGWAERPVFATSGMASPGEGLGAALSHLALPVVTLSMASAARFVRFQRGAMLEVMSSDYVRAARAKGLPRPRVYLKHALKNALLPTVTLLALSMSTITGALAVVEVVFSWPGLGYLMIDSLFEGDYQVLRALLMINVLLVVFFGLLADLAYALLDPRVADGR
jgi:peptide/nickel transport system permease protein